MNDNLALWWPLALVMYLFLFGIFDVLVAMMGHRLYMQHKDWRKTLGMVLAVATPVVGFAFYLMVDSFERQQKEGQWWIVIYLIHILPLLLEIYLLFGKRLSKKH